MLGSSEPPEMWGKRAVSGVEGCRGARDETRVEALGFGVCRERREPSDPSLVEVTSGFSSGALR